jgi:hypothetical protein
MESVIDFGNLLTGLQYLPEREKIILMALINAQPWPKMATCQRSSAWWARLSSLRRGRTIGAPTRKTQPRIVDRRVHRGSAAFAKVVSRARSANSWNSATALDTLR